MSYIVMNNVLLVPMPLDELPVLFYGDCIPFETKSGTTKYMIKRSNIVEAYILCGCDERFPPEILQDYIDDQEKS